MFPVLHRGRSSGFSNHGQVVARSDRFSSESGPLLPYSSHLERSAIRTGSAGSRRGVEASTQRSGRSAQRPVHYRSRDDVGDFAVDTVPKGWLGWPRDVRRGGCGDCSIIGPVHRRDFGIATSDGTADSNCAGSRGPQGTRHCGPPARRRQPSGHRQTSSASGTSTSAPKDFAMAVNSARAD